MRAGIGGFHDFFMPRAALKEWIDDVVGAMPAKPVGLASREYFDFFWSIGLVKNPDRSRYFEWHFGLAGEDLPAGQARQGLANALEPLVQRFALQQRFAAAGRAIDFDVLRW